jgi:hypothetical protein
MARRLLIFAFVMCAATAIVRAETIDRVVAVVAGHVIMLSDVSAAQELGLETADPAPDPVRAMLSRLIDRELMLAEVDRYAPPEPDAAAVDRGLAAIRGRFASPSGFENVLARCGIDETLVRESIRQNLRITAYLEQRFSPADPRRQALIADWLAGLKRRGDVVDLFAASQ